jgi:hypothetical protein
MVHTGSVASNPPVTLSLAARRAQVLDIAAALIAINLLVVVMMGRVGVLRLLFALAFAFFVPGRAVVTNWPRIERWSTVAMSMVFSLAILTLLATGSLWLHAWHPVGLFEVEALLSLIGLVIGAARRHRVTYLCAQTGEGEVSQTIGPLDRRIHAIGLPGYD